MPVSGSLHFKGFRPLNEQSPNRVRPRESERSCTNEIPLRKRKNTPWNVPRHFCQIDYFPPSDAPFLFLYTSIPKTHFFKNYTTRRPCSLVFIRSLKLLFASPFWFFRKHLYAEKQMLEFQSPNLLLQINAEEP